MRNQFGTGPGTGSSWHDRSDNQSPNVQKVLFCDGLNLFWILLFIYYVLLVQINYFALKIESLLAKKLKQDLIVYRSNHFLEQT